MDLFTVYGDANRYKILEVIGKENYGVVCAAVNTHTREKVVIKKINNVFDTHLRPVSYALRGEALILFVLLTPGLLFQIPARGRIVEFGNMQTSGASILVHSIIFFGLITIFTIAIRLHIYTG
ncbi:hypothetical protein HID58_081734 [Brassica napus]|uniref:Protein kinase domain-containing protein n=1 Tax=Brassica napus TaxID=3708 RepID=A0ABQ7YB93_BRANA|nr:hypothetical protein HID58_081734 [Brassica napus]